MWNRRLGIVIGALLAFSLASACRTATEAKTGVGKHLVAEDLVLVKPDGVPWLAMYSGGFERGPSISLFDGESEVIYIGSIEVPASEGKAAVRVPSIRVESADGEGFFSVIAMEEHASVAIDYLDGPGVSISANEEQVAFDFKPTLTVEDEEDLVRNRLIFRGTQVLLELTRGGEVQTIDLSAIGAPASPPSRPPR